MNSKQTGLIHAHLPLAKSMARSHRGRGVTAEDLIGEAYLGLCEAAAESERARTSFAGFARGKIRTRLMTAIGHASVFRRDVRSERAGTKVPLSEVTVEEMAVLCPLPNFELEELFATRIA